MSDSEIIQDKPSWWLVAINIIPGVCLLTWLFYILLRKKYPRKAKYCMLGGIIGAIVCCILPTVVYGHFSVLLAILTVAYFILYFTHDAFTKTKNGEYVKNNECEMETNDQPIESSKPAESVADSLSKKIVPKRTSFFALLKKIITSKKGWLALYLCYELIILCVYYSDNGFIDIRYMGYYSPEEFQAGPYTISYYYKFHGDTSFYSYRVLDIETILQFLLVSLIPLFIYWIVRLFVEASKDNK